MLTRSIALFSFGVAAVLFGASQSDAQPGKSKGPGTGPDIKKLEQDLERLLDQVEKTKADLARAKERGKGKGGFGPKGFEGKGFPGKGKGFEGKKGFPGKGKGFEGKGFEGKGKGKGKGKDKGDFKKKDEPKKETPKADFGAKLDPATIREKYAFYKKLFDELPKEPAKGPTGFGGRGFGGFGRGPMGTTPGAGGVEARIDRLIRELEDLRKEVRAKKN